ncbi:L,D-transpeptidase family protein [Sphingobium subterraneum]|uniref:L,D-peptidoglycan transpeptidase YkuD (ErfK/YbiS/YcfS/YnhG family) n=1 Tax=Sphingobium subterraneum TaxID=627688 RepID=A0A841IVH0_9SPHN|nr:L,D-transpeptidase family protein [Sphingobium subterraneum]MBB6122334.1 L,D-peptidoglycan transpeptidase YkuD (ErfK/YbiS/YcfS/YnhG family) [Sphingobium subterraneum]
MERIIVDALSLTLSLGAQQFPCVIGKGGWCAADDKREGDGRTPLGLWPVSGVLLRPGRISLTEALKLPWRWTRKQDGWSDDPADPQYNRPVMLPHGFSAETLQRDDHAYDVIVVLGHNDAPPVPGRGSAIFFHIWNPCADGAPNATEGCVAIDGAAMLSILQLLRPGMLMEIRA